MKASRTSGKEFAPLLAELRYMWHLFKLNRLVLAGSIIAAAVVIISLAAPLLIPETVILRISPSERLLPPSEKHLMGTDEYGRDIFGQAMLSLTTDLSASLTIVVGATTIGILLGSVAGFLGGKIDEALMRITDVFLAFPTLILALAVAAVLGRNLNNLVLAIAVVAWPGYTRLIRGNVLAEKEKLYVEALKALGIGRRRIILRHVVPNTIYPILVAATLDFGGYMITFAALSFLGFGASPFTPELGRMVATGRDYLFQAPWYITFPGLLILVASLAFNLLGDGLRDILDPRLRR